MDETVDLLDGDKVTPLAHNFVTAAAFDPKGQLLVTAGKAGTLKTWSAAGGKLVAKEQFAARGSDDGERVVQLLFSPDGQYLVARSSGPAVRIYGLERFRPLPEVQALLRQRVTRDLNNDERELYLQAVGRWWWP
jgi:WD40 repeat protein